MQQVPQAAPLGIIAGGGALPAMLAAAIAGSGRPVFVLALDGHADITLLASFPHQRIRLGAIGEGLNALRSRNIQDLVLVGTVRRPSVLSLMPDAEGARLLARIGRAAFSGDDGLLSAIVRVLEEEGFRVHGVQTILSELTAPEGALTQLVPDAEAEADIARGAAVCRLLGAADVGQAVVVQQGLVLGVEAIEGTDALLERCALLRREGPGGVLVKRAKPRQESRVDLPTIGATTVARAAAAGLRGIAVEAETTLMPERAATIEAADRAGLFLVARRFTT